MGILTSILRELILPSGDADRLRRFYSRDPGVMGSGGQLDITSTPNPGTGGPVPGTKYAPGQAPVVQGTPAGTPIPAGSKYAPGDNVAPAPQARAAQPQSQTGAGMAAPQTQMPTAGGQPVARASGQPQRGIQPAVDYQPGSIVSHLGISPQQWDTYRNSLARIESGGVYNKVGGSNGHYTGRYQFGAPEIANSAKALGEQPPSRGQFLNDPAMQERYLEVYTLQHSNYLMKNPKYANASPEEKLAVLGYAHNQGEGGANKWLNTGVVGHDAFGTGGDAYSKSIMANLSKPPSNDNTMQPGNTANTQTAAAQPQAQSPQSQSPPQRPTQMAANSSQQPGSGGNYLAIGDSLAVGVGGKLGNTNYAHSGWNPEAVNGLVGKAIQSGDVQGKHIILSGGASNAGGNSGMVSTYYPQMISALKNAGASQVTVMGVGPYSHYDNYGYNNIIDGVAKTGGANFTGPLANIAPFRGSSVQQQVHPADYSPIISYVKQNFDSPNGSSSQMAQNVPKPAPTGSSSPQPSTTSPSPAPAASQQMASMSKVAPPTTPTPSTPTPPPQAANTNTPPPQQTAANTDTPQPNTKVALASSFIPRGKALESYRRPAITLLRPF